MKLILIIPFLIITSCNNPRDKQYTKKDLLKYVSLDSLVFDKKENSYTDRFGDSSGSYYKFNKDGNLIFYCFLNGKIYPYAEYFDSKGNIEKIEGKPSIQVRYTTNSDSSYQFSFLFSTFRKSMYQIKTVTNFGDTLLNDIESAKAYSNVGFFNLVVRNRADALKTTLFNHVSYFDSVRNENYAFVDTVPLQTIIIN